MNVSLLAQHATAAPYVIGALVGIIGTLIAGAIFLVLNHRWTEGA